MTSVGPVNESSVSEQIEPRCRKWPAVLVVLMLFVAQTFVAAAASSSAAVDWPGFRGPDGSGRVNADWPDGSGELRLRTRWKRAIGSGYSGVAVAEGVAVTASSTSEHDIVLAFDPHTGEELWTAELGPLTVGAGGSKDGPISTPAIAEGRVFVVSTEGRLMAHDLRSGERLWSVDLVEDLGSSRPLYGFATSPLVADQVLVVQAGGSAGALVGLEVSTGALLWRAFDDRHYAQSPILAQLAGREQVVVIGSQQLAGIDPRTGEELWSHQHGGTGEFGPESTSPVPVGDDRLFVKHDNERTSVLRIELEDDESMNALPIAESRTMTRSYSPPTVWEDTVYGYTSRFLSALDTATGDELWRSRAPGDGFLAAVGGLLLVVTKNDGTAHLAQASREGWVELDQITLFDDLVWTPPSFADGAFYVRSLTELARVDVVRAEVMTEQQLQDLPPELDRLRREVQGGADAESVVARFLSGLDGPLVDGERVLFLWRGDAEEVGIAGDMFGFRYDEPMRRLDLDGTTLWWWQTELDRRGRFSYVFFPDYEPALDPRNPRSVESTVMGPKLDHRADQALQMSWFAMPEWPGRLATDREATEFLERGRLERFELDVELSPARGASEGTERQSVSVPVTVWLPPDYDDGERRYPLVMSLERYALSIGDWPSALDRAVAAPEARAVPLIAVMIDAPAEFSGRRGGGRVAALVPSVLAEVDRRYRTLAEPSQRAVVGALYTAPPAVSLALGEDRLFGRLALQSPFAIDVMLPMYGQMMQRAAGAPRPQPFYFEWARWDVRSPGEGLVLSEFMEDLHHMFRDAGYEPVGGEVWDSTDWAGWRNRTELILEILFPVGPPQPPAELTTWLVR